MEKKRITLDELPRKNPFAVPEHYFDELPQRIQTRATRPAPTPAFTISWNWQRTVASLAGAGLVVALLFETLPRKQGALGTETLSTVENTAIVDYLYAQNLTPFDLEESLGKMAPLPSGAAVGVEQLNVSDRDILEHLKTENVEDVL